VDAAEGRALADPDLGAQVAALRTVRDIVRAARAFGPAAHGDEVLERVASLAVDVLGYRACAIARGDDDGNFRYRAHFVAAPGRQGSPGDLVCSGHQGSPGDLVCSGHQEAPGDLVCSGHRGAPATWSARATWS
jgi:hypothetical protein